MLLLSHRPRSQHDDSALFVYGGASMDRVSRAITPASLRAGKPRRTLAAAGALASLLCLCVHLTPSAAQAGASPAPAAPAGAQVDTKALILQFDRLLAENHDAEAYGTYRLLLESRANAVAAGLELLSRRAISSELTVNSMCTLASDEVPAEMSTLVLEHVLASSSLGDWTKMHCIDRLSSHVDSSFRDLLLEFATDPHRNVNLRISALKVASSKWPSQSQQTLVQLLQSAQEPIMHHKALQYLAGSGQPDVLPLVEGFVLNRDPATAGIALSKEYGLLILRSRLGAGVLPLLASILQDESWPSEIQDRSIDLLAHSDLPGGTEILADARVHAGTRLRSRIDMVLTEPK
jgi:hypothetical protein